MTSKAKQASLYEPSPASTYGDSAAGNSTPATPGEGGGQGMRSLLWLLFGLYGLSSTFISSCQDPYLVASAAAPSAQIRTCFLLEIIAAIRNEFVQL